MRCYPLAIGLAGLLGMAQGASAQDFIGPMLIRQGIEPQVQAQRKRAAEAAGHPIDTRAIATNRLVAAPAPVPQASQHTLSFTPSPERRKANLAHFVETSRATDPQGAAAMQKLFASTDVIAAMGRSLASVGLRTSNVADAYAVWWMTSWSAAHGSTETPNRATAQAVKAQAARAIASAPGFSEVADADKQQYAEAMLVQAAMIEAMTERYGSDAAMAPKIAAAARSGARASGLDLDAMTLTEGGFVPAG